MKLLIGSAGVLGIEAVNTIPPTSNIVEIGKLILQGIVAFATIWKMFKKPKEVQQVQQDNELDKIEKTKKLIINT